MLEFSASGLLDGQDWVLYSVVDGTVTSFLLPEGATAWSCVAIGFSLQTKEVTGYALCSSATLCRAIEWTMQLLVCSG